MERKFRGWFVLFVLVFAAGAATFPVQAQSDTPVIGLLRGQPCSGGWRIQAGYPPQASCWGLDQMVATTTLIPVPRAFNSAPQYPLVGLTTALGVDWDPASFGVAQTRTDIFRPQSEWFINYRVEIKISSLNRDGYPYNNITATNRVYQLNDKLGQVEWGYSNTYLSACQSYTLEHVQSAWGGWQGCRSNGMVQRQLGDGYTISTNGIYDMSGAQPDWMWLGSQVSSKQGSAQKYGEPAFGIQVLTYWTVWARSNWDHYYHWDCWDEPVIDPITGKPVINPRTGEPQTREVCDWVDGGSGGGYHYLGQVTLNYLVVPEQGVQPLYPVPVFQSQPLLVPANP